MVFFKRKNQEEAEKPKKSLPPIERVLTAEGWRRRATIGSTNKGPKAK
jgi:hypothetical protein